LPGSRLSGVVYDLDAALGDVGNTGELADHLIHLASDVLRGTMGGDKRVEARDPDLVLLDRLDDLLDRPTIYGERTTARSCDPDRHLHAAGDK
jgi:hypothetical protein